MQLDRCLEDDVEERLDPLGDHSRDEYVDVGDGHALQVDARRRATHASLRHDGQHECVAAQTHHEDARPDVDPQRRRHHRPVRRVPGRRLLGHCSVGDGGVETRDVARQLSVRRRHRVPHGIFPGPEVT